METIKLGSQGESVKTLQKLLNSYGFNIKEDGNFGAKTEAAVKSLQSRLNIVSDGIVGQKTYNAIQSTYGYKFEVSDDIDITKLFLSKHITKTNRNSIKYLVIHFTAGASSAPGKSLGMKNTFENREASADFGVDDLNIVQFNPDPLKYYCWSVGDGKGKYGITNSNSISIEICSNLKKGRSAKYGNTDGWYFTEDSLNNALKLAKYLMKKYNIPKDRVVRHWDVNSKNCPGLIGWNKGYIYDDNGKKIGQNNENEWLKFKDRL